MKNQDKKISKRNIARLAKNCFLALDKLIDIDWDAKTPPRGVIETIENFIEQAIREHQGEKISKRNIAPPTARLNHIGSLVTLPLGWRKLRGNTVAQSGDMCWDSQDKTWTHSVRQSLYLGAKRKAFNQAKYYYCLIRKDT